MTVPYLTKHSRQRIRERFNVPEGRESLFFRQNFAKAEKLAESIGDDNYIREYHVAGDIIFVIAHPHMAVVTVEQKVSKAIERGMETFKARIQAFIKSEIDRATSAAHAAESFFTELDEDIRAELPELQAQLKRARSLPKRLALMGRIEALEMRIAELPAEIKGARSEARREINGALAHY